jgi:hypothetical protein
MICAKSTHTGTLSTVLAPSPEKTRNDLAQIAWARRNGFRLHSDMKGPPSSRPLFEIIGTDRLARKPGLSRVVLFDGHRDEPKRRCKFTTDKVRNHEWTTSR